jgi:2-oxoglutarate ferredoxin oxidoreductase subunit delta
MAEKPEQKKKKYKPKVFKGTVHVVKSRCKGCGFCIDYCPKKLLKTSKDFNAKGYHYPVVIDENACVNCKICEDICPEFAIFSVTKDEKDQKPKTKDQKPKAKPGSSH